jgi:hypothetical protein
MKRIVPMLVLVLALAACGGGDEPSAGATNTSTTPTEHGSSSPRAIDARQTIAANLTTPTLSR